MKRHCYKNRSQERGDRWKRKGKWTSNRQSKLNKKRNKQNKRTCHQRFNIKMDKSVGICCKDLQ